MIDAGVVGRLAEHIQQQLRRLGSVGPSVVVARCRQVQCERIEDDGLLILRILSNDARHGLGVVSLPRLPIRCGARTEERAGCRQVFLPRGPAVRAGRGEERAPRNILVPTVGRA